MTERRGNLILTGLLGIMIVALVAATIWLGRDEYQQLAREHGETIGADKPADEKHEPGRIELWIARADLDAARALVSMINLRASEALLERATDPLGR